MIRIGRAEIDLPFVGEVKALTAEAAGRRAGPDADARAHLVLRPYVTTAVELTLVDPDDPVPVLAGLDPPTGRVGRSRSQAARRPVDDLGSPGARGSDDPRRAAPARSGARAYRRTPTPATRVPTCSCAEDFVLGPGERRLVGTGVAIALPDGYAALRASAFRAGGPTRHHHRQHPGHGRRGLPRRDLGLSAQHRPQRRGAASDAATGSPSWSSSRSVRHDSSRSVLQETARGIGGHGSTGGILAGPSRR